MFRVKIVQKVTQGSAQLPGVGIGWLTKITTLPFAPYSGLFLSFPFHKESLMPFADVSVEVENVVWSEREQMFTANCATKYLIDLARPEFAETDLVRYLKEQMLNAWDCSFNEADIP